MRSLLTEYLACPQCGGALALRADAEEEGHVLEGELACGRCPRTFAITSGVPRLNIEMGGLENVARTFSFEWKGHHAGRFETQTLFGRTLEEDWEYFLFGLGIGPEDVVGAAVVDAGCGSGRFARLVGGHGARLVVGLDINEAVDEAFALTRGMPNVHIVQGNVWQPPLKAKAFDLIWCNGVLHHTPDAKRGHSALSRLVAPNGRLYVWVYAKRFNPFRLVKSVLNPLGLQKLSEPWLYRLTAPISAASLGLLQVYRALRRLPGLRARSPWALRTVRARTFEEIRLTWFDALSPEFDSRHTDDELRQWFIDAGFQEVEAIEEPKVGVRGVAPADG